MDASLTASFRLVLADMALLYDVLTITRSSKRGLASVSEYTALVAAVIHAEAELALKAQVHPGGKSPSINTLSQAGGLAGGVSGGLSGGNGINGGSSGGASVSEGITGTLDANGSPNLQVNPKHSPPPPYS